MGDFLLADFRDLDLDAIKGILIDIDNTLYNYTAGHRIALNACWAWFEIHIRVNVTQDEFKIRYRSCRTDVTKRLTGQGACRSRLFAFQKLLEDLNHPNAWVSAKTLEDLYWNTLLDNMQPHEKLISWLREQRASGRRLCAVTNMQAGIQIAKLQRLGLEDDIDFLVTSEETGHEKPHPAMYRVALAKLGISPDDAIMLGDSETDDVKGAAQVGIRSCLIDDFL